MGVRFIGRINPTGRINAREYIPLASAANFLYAFDIYQLGIAY